MKTMAPTGMSEPIEVPVSTNTHPMTAWVTQVVFHFADGHTETFMIHGAVGTQLQHVPLHDAYLLFVRQGRKMASTSR